MALVNFDFYENEDKYGGTLIKDDEAFNALLKRSMAFLNKRTFNRIIQNENGEYGQMVYGKFLPFTKQELEVLKYGLCGLTDAMAKLEKAEVQAFAGNESSKNVKSRSSGGESISYESRKTVYDEALADKTKKDELLRSALMEFIQPDAFRYNPFYAGSW